MNDTQIKTRHGLILQGITAAALGEAGYSFVADVQYDPTCERPDFLIPNAEHPKYMVEVHQTDARNSLAMKTLRAFVAVTEAKARFGGNLISVNLIFGDPDEDFSSSPLSALSAIYDLNVFPAREPSAKKALQRLERASIELAADPEFTTRQAIEAICRKNAPAIATFAATLRAAMALAAARPNLNQLWQAESVRQRALGRPPLAGRATYYKRTMLAALFFTDEAFESLLNGAKNDAWPAAAVGQLKSTGLARITEEIDGDRVQINPEFLAYLKDPQASHLRGLCKEVLDSVPEMHWFFEDIRDADRRLGMCKLFLRALRAGKRSFVSELRASLVSESYMGFGHLRGWFIDLSAVATAKSFNHYNKAIFQDSRYPLSLWNAFSNLAIRSPAMLSHATRLITLCEIVGDKVYEALDESEIEPSDLSEQALASGLLQLRIVSAIKLRKLNPLLIVVTNVAAEYGLKVTRPSIDTLLFDLAEDAGVGRFLVYSLSEPRSGRSVLLSVVAVHEGNGDHKSKEWGARRISSLYRFRDGEITKSGFSEGLFVIDGEWEDKDIARLHRSGWNRICRLGDLETALKQIFGLKGKAKRRERPNPAVVFESDEEPG